MQTATRLTEFLCIELAMEEVQRGNVGWEYFDGAEVWEGDPKEVADLERLDEDSAPAEADPQRKEVAFSESDDANSESLDGDSASGEEEEDGNSASGEEEVETRTGGTRIRIFEDKENGNETKFKVLGRSKTADATLWPGEVVDFLNELQKKVVDYIPWMELPVLTEHQRYDVIWRGHPN